jgi:septal ring factor EnvC (AmiA/AmiB activator)
VSEQVIVALIAALTGGTALKLIEGWLGRAADASEDLIAFRRELVQENRRLAQQLEETRATLHKVERMLSESQHQCAEALERSERLLDQVKRLRGET